MKLKVIIACTCLLAGLLFINACGNDNSGSSNRPPKVDNPQELTNNQPEHHGNEIKESDVQIANPLDQKMIAEGKSTYELKCQSCHKLSGEKLVGPGWKDVTKRRKPVWIMNMITNVDMMLETDPEAQKLLEQCLTRMPNQNISTAEARNVLEFMRSNDGEK